MEVLVGSSFTIDVSSSSSSFVRDRTAGSPPPDSLKSRFGSFQSEIDRKEIDDDFHSDSSSSIGDPDDDSDNDNNTVSSHGRFAALKSLEESLPTKRGLSNHFSGKSKSFVNLAEANSVNDIEKPENPLNKRRRILIATKWIRKSALYSFPNHPKSMPLLALKEEEEENDDEEEEEGPFNDEDEYEESNSRRKRVIDFHKRKLMSFKSRSCFSLMDLQQHEHHDEQQEQ